MPTANTISVTLTAEDQATEIVRRLTAEMKRFDAATRGSAAGTKQLASASQTAASGFAGMAKGVTALGAAIGVARLAGFAKDVIDSTDQLGKLAQKTGVTPEALSVLKLAASTADLSLDDLGTALKLLSKSLTDLRGGSATAVADFKALGLSAKDFVGLSLDQVLVKIADAQEGFNDGAGKAAVLLKLFGKSGTDLIPLLHDLATGGFKKTAEEAKRLGVVVGGDAAKAAQDFNDSLTRLGQAAQGFVIQMTPALTSISSMIDLATTLTAKIREGLASTSAETKANLKRSVLEAAGTIGGPIPVLLLMLKKLSAAKEEAFGPLSAPIAGKPTKKGDVNPPADTSAIKALADARIAAAQSAARSELAIDQATIQQKQQLQEDAFQEGLISLSAYFASREALVQKSTKKQINELNAELGALKATPTDGSDAALTKRLADEKSIEAQIAAVRINGQTQVLALQAQERQQRLQIENEIRDFNNQILRDTGNEAKARQAEDAARVEQFGKLLAAQAAVVSADSKLTQQQKDRIAQQQQELSSLLTNRTAFANLQDQVQQSFSELDAQRRAIQQRVDQGQLSERDGAQALLLVERDRVTALTQAVDLMEKFAEKIGDATLKAKVRDLRTEIGGMGVAIDEAAKRIKDMEDNLGKTISQGIESDLSTFLGSTISQVTSLGDAFRQLALSIVSTVQQALANIIAANLVHGLSNAVSSGPADVATQTAAKELGAAGLVVSGAAKSVGDASATLGGAGLVVQRSAGGVLESSTALGAAGLVVKSAADRLLEAAAALAAASIGGGALLAASGGYVRGPGSSTSDSIPARLSAGEFIIRASAVKHYGVDFFRALNGARMPTLRRPTVGGLPAFATGGLVTAGGSGANVSGGIDVTVGVDEDSLIRAVVTALKTRGALRALREVVGNNPRAFQAALQIG